MKGGETKDEPNARRSDGNIEQAPGVFSQMHKEVSLKCPSSLFSFSFFFRFLHSAYLIYIEEYANV